MKKQILMPLAIMMAVCFGFNTKTNAQSAITGSTSVCVGSTISLSDATTGGTWSSSNIVVATVSSTGVVSGVGGGVDTISYTVGVSTVTQVITVSAPFGSTTSGIISTIAGNGTSGYSGDGGAATASELYNPFGVAVDNSGNVYIADRNNYRIRKINTSGIISTIAGNGTAGFSGDGGAATAAELNNPVGVAVDNSGNVYIADYSNSRIRKINTSGIISTIAGNGTYGYSGDGGAATAAGLNYPVGVAVDNSGNVYIADYGNDRIRKINTSGIISTIAGNGTYGFSGDGGAATAAELYYPQGVAVDNSGNVYIADEENNRIRKINTTGIISTIAGNGTGGYTGDGGAATAAELYYPYGVAVDNSGNVYIADYSNERIRKINTSGIISTIAGNGTLGFSGDGGAATAAELYYPLGVAIDNSGILYIADYGNNSIRKVTPSITTSIAAITGSNTVATGSSITLSDSTTGGTWSSTTATIATVSVTGAVYGVSAGIDTIKYTVTNACGTAVVSQIITVNAALAAIYGSSSVCMGNSITLTDSTTSGTWSSISVGLATVSSSGVVTGVSAGTDTIKYTLGSISVFKIITVNPLPTAGSITGTATVCAGATTSLSDATGSGTWSSVSTGVASVNTSGVVSGVTAGTSIISYTVINSCGTSVATTTVTVNPLPVSGSITGSGIVCAGGTVTPTTSLSDIAVGGTWSSVTLGIATVNSTGVVYGVAAGTTTISYTVSNGCGISVATTLITVNSLPNSGVITGNAPVCAGSTLTLVDVATGGTWSSVSTGIATIGPSGVVSGVSAGTSIISYTVTNSCGVTTSTTIVTVNPLPVSGSITGTGIVCAGGTVTPTTTLTDVSIGGTWSSSVLGIATVNGTGGVFGVSAGNATISYTVSNSCGSSSATILVTVNPLPVSGVITGGSIVCSGGATLPLGNVAFGGVWSSISTAIATINSTGLVTGISSGTSIISYTVTNSCGVSAATEILTVNPAPVSGSITGTAVVCAGGATTSLADAAPGGTWSSVSTVVASVNSSGLVTGGTPGTTPISYTVVNSCGTSVSSVIVTVNPVPVSGSILGTALICTGGVTTLSNFTTGGTWSSVSTGIATISNIGGVVSGLSVGTSLISYTITNSCGASAATVVVTVNPAPVSGSITGTTVVCAGAASTLSDVATGGVWSSVSTSIATISSTGVVTGISAGTALISYTVISSCGLSAATKIVTVNPLPNTGSITGIFNVCAGATTSLSDLATGGTWSSVSTGIATINSTGLVSGVTTGTSLISYMVTNGCGVGAATITITVNPAPIAGTITGTVSVLCVGIPTTLSDITGGGTWSAKNGHGSIDNLLGIVTGISSGIDTFYYGVSNSCGTAYAPYIITFNPLPVIGSILGLDSVCTSVTLTMSDTSVSGIWSVSDTTKASISNTGIVSGLVGGADTVKYTITHTCSNTALKVITVNPQPNAGSIIGATNICVGATVTLLETSPGGTWFGTNSRATINPTGVVTGNTLGIDTIKYYVNNVCGSATISNTINIITTPTVGPVLGASAICVGAALTLADSSATGTWSKSNTNASISTTGVVTANSQGTDTLTYTITNTCGSNHSIAVVTINPLPNAGTITGSNTVCVGSWIYLSDLVSGGTWTINNGNGTLSTDTVIGVSAGRDTINYSFTNGCGTAVVHKYITINPLPAVNNIIGDSIVCVSAVLTLSDSTFGGTWTKTNTNVTITSSGSVTGAVAGIDTIYYTYSNMCGAAVAVQQITINPLPSATAILGMDSVCMGNNITLIDTTAGGYWNIVNTNANIDPTGIVYGINTGTDSVQYIITNSCGNDTVIKKIVINPLPYAGIILGVNAICPGAKTTFSDTILGGSWSVSNTKMFISAIGIDSGIVAGLDTVIYTYTNVCGTNIAYKAVTINPLPTIAPITGVFSVCQGSNITLNDAISGGTWSASNSKAILSANIVHGNSVGLDTIMYTYTNFCGTLSTDTTITIQPLPYAGVISGLDSVCIGSHITLEDTLVATGTWSANNTNATVSSIGIITGIHLGYDSIKFTNTNSCGSISTGQLVKIVTIPTVAAISGPDSVCKDQHIVLVDATPGGVWSSNNNTVAVVAGPTITGNGAGLDTITYRITNTCGSSIATYNIAVINPLPKPVISGLTYACIGGIGDVLNTDQTGGYWTISNNLASLTGNVLTATIPGKDTVYYTVSNLCGSSTGKLIVKLYSREQCDSINYVLPINAASPGIKIYPNPATTQFTIELSELQTVERITIMDMYGKIVLNKEDVVPQEVKINIETYDLASGTYLISVKVGEKIFREKLVIVGDK